MLAQPLQQRIPSQRHSDRRERTLDRAAGGLGVGLAMGLLPAAASTMPPAEMVGCERMVPENWLLLPAARAVTLTEEVGVVPSSISA